MVLSINSGDAHFFFFLIGGLFLYNIGMVFAIHQHELAIHIHVSPISWIPRSPSHFPPHPRPFRLSQSTDFGSPASYKLPPAIWLLHGNVHVSVLLSQIIPPSPSPTESKSLFVVSGLLCCPACRIVSTIFLESIYVLIYDICLSLSDLVHSV